MVVVVVVVAVVVGCWMVVMVNGDMMMIMDDREQPPMKCGWEWVGDFFGEFGIGTDGRQAGRLAGWLAGQGWDRVVESGEW